MDSVESGLAKVQSKPWYGKTAGGVKFIFIFTVALILVAVYIPASRIMGKKSEPDIIIQAETHVHHLEPHHDFISVSTGEKQQQQPNQVERLVGGFDDHLDEIKRLEDYNKNVTVHVDENENEYENSGYCSKEGYPEYFMLSGEGIEFLKRDGHHEIYQPACTPLTLYVYGMSLKNTLVRCRPWVDMQARVLGPDLPFYPGAKAYSMNFNNVKVQWAQKDKFELHIPPLDPGMYYLEILLVHDENAHHVMYGEMINTRSSRCIDTGVAETPVPLIINDDKECPFYKAEETPLCKSGSLPGRWVTAPSTGCDGVVCEGNLDVLASSNRVWAPYDCHYKIHSPDDFKECFRDKKILVAGDSVTQEFANELVQLYMYKDRLPIPWDMTQRDMEMRRSLETFWRSINDKRTLIGYSIVMASPLGCGIDCVLKLSPEKLEELLLHHGKVDVLLISTGVHEVAPLDKLHPKHKDVFVEYEKGLPEFIKKMEGLVKEGGMILWMTTPDGSDLARCSYHAKPRLERINEITKRFVENYLHGNSSSVPIHLVDFFSVSENCQCGNLHKGLRFMNYENNKDASKTYNGFISRMTLNMALTMACDL
ncbi:uncharacterized protein [Ptychodera flava]|uniref:uncharacterized protein n=1 Tax=Ptychodera flava TaxID=63121 RepID=UPI003969C79F